MTNWPDINHPFLPSRPGCTLIITEFLFRVSIIISHLKFSVLLSPLNTMRVFLFAILYAIFLITNAEQSRNGEAEQELVLVQSLWRHGDRSPTATFKNDRYQEDDWPQGWGQLTPTGMAQHVRLGKKLRKRYVTDLQFVSEHYKNHEIYVRSTDYNRTLISAISNLIGFYGPGTDKDYPKELGDDWPGWYSPIAIHTISNREDFIAPGAAECPRYAALEEMLPKAPEYQETIERYKGMLEFLTEKAGEPLLEKPMDLWLLADAFYIEKLKNLPLVEWAENNQTLLDAITELNDIQSKWTSGIGLTAVDGVKFAEEFPRMRGGTILWKMIGNMRDKLICQKHMAKRAGMEAAAEPVEVRGRKSPLGGHLCKWVDRMRYFAYSAHDSTIAALFSTFGFSKPNYDLDDYPHYSACVTVELWRDKTKNELNVKVLYWRPENASFIDMTQDIKGCETGCTLDQFAQRSLPYQMLPSPVEYCKKPLFDGNGDTGNSAYSQARGRSWKIFRLMLTLFLLIITIMTDKW